MMKSSFTAVLLASMLVSVAASAANGWTGQIETFDDITELLAARSIDQTADGTIWFGTDKCLYSFDGYDVRAYSGGSGQRQINSLQHDGDILYLGCNDGVLTFDTQTQQYQRIDFFRDIRIDKLAIFGRNLYIGGESGLYRYRLDGESNGSTISKISSISALSMSYDNDTIWVGTSYGIDIYDCKTGRYKENALDLNNGWNLGQVVTGIYKSPDDIIWAGTITSLIRIDIKSMSIDAVAGLGVAKDLIPDGRDGLFVGTDNGLVHYDIPSGTLESVRQSVVSQCFMGEDADFWFASGNGIFRIGHDNEIGTLDTGNAPENAMYRCIYRDTKGRLWVAGSQGIALYTGGRNSPYSLVRRYSMDNELYHLAHNSIKTIVEDRNDGSIYLATDAGYLRYNEHLEGFETYWIFGTHNWIYDILIDGNKKWFATFDGLYCLQDGLMIDGYSIFNGLSCNDVAQIAKDRSGFIWVLTRDQNVFTLDPKAKLLEQFSLPDKTIDHFASCIISDFEGNIWISTGNEIVYVDDFPEDSNPVVIALDTQKSLDIYSMQDILDCIWVCTSEGIFIIDKADFSIRTINTRKRCVSLSLDRDNGNIMFGALGQVNYMPASELDVLTRQDKCNVTITSLTVNGNRQINKNDIGTKPLVLPSWENNLTITFSDFNYNREMPRKFHVFVRGRKYEWSDLVQKNVINIPDMKPGRHEVFISAQDKLEPNDSPVLTIRIKSPLMLSVPMLLLYLFIILNGIFWTIRFLTLKKYLDLEREQREALLKQSKEKEAFFGNIAHEFKTPLSLIIAPLSKLIQEVQDPEQRDMLKIAHDNSTKLNALVHQTIDYYRDDVGKINDLIKSEVDFVEFARSIFQSFKDNYPNLEFIFDSSSKMIPVHVDVVKMEIVLNNLLSNACKYTPEGGSVILTLERDEETDKLIIKVSDTGIGIPEDELGLVFQRYFESSRSKGGHYDGTGIGLSICKKHVESHDGSISVASDSNGTTFTTIIPCCTDERFGSDAISVRGSDADSSDKPLIVIVDDNVQICTFLEKALKNRYNCISTGNGKSGLKLCKDVMPDLIVTDVMMPVMDGLEMCSQIREYSPLSTIPIIMLTAKGDTETEMKSIELNIDAFIPKPFEFSTLAAKIDQLLGNSRRMEKKIRLEMISEPKIVEGMSNDEMFLMKVTRMIEEHIEDSGFSVRSLCEMGGYGEKQLYRRIKQLTGLPTVEYIRSIRMKKAALLFQTGNYTVSEVMYMVGFTNASYFTRSFVAEFGTTPSEYQKSFKAEGTL